MTSVLCNCERDNKKYDNIQTERRACHIANTMVSCMSLIVYVVGLSGVRDVGLTLSCYTQLIATKCQLSSSCRLAY